MRLITVSTSWVLIGLIVLTTVAWAQENPPRDVAGWQDTRWGMSPLELKKLHGNKLKIKRQDDREILAIDGYDLFGINFAVKFFWKDGSKLSKVILTNEDIQGDLSNIAAKLLSSLKFKYGNGNIIKKERSDPTSAPFLNVIAYTPGSDNLEVRWVFPKTVITYSHFIMKNLDPEHPVMTSMISVIYEPNETNKL